MMQRIGEIKNRIAEIDRMQETELNNQEYDRLEEEARKLYAELGMLENIERLKDAKEIHKINDWTKNFLDGFSSGTRKITIKQAEIFKKINNGKSFIFNKRRYDFTANYRIGFGTLTITNIF